MKILFIILSLYLSLSINPMSVLAYSNSSTLDKSSAEYNVWLKEKFSQQHEELIPIVAVADMFYACNKARKVDPTSYRLEDLVKKMDKNQLADKLALCLGENLMQSDVALNFGLLGCFHEQLAHLPKAEREQKMVLVEKAIFSLSRSERKKSFTQCVTEQAIHYLQ